MNGMRWIFTGAPSGFTEMCWRLFPRKKAILPSGWNFFGDEIDRVTQIDTLTGELKADLKYVANRSRPSHYVVPMDTILRATKEIEKELEERVQYFKSEGKLLEAQRIEERTNFDMEMLRETGVCSGIENYPATCPAWSRGQPPYTLMDFFPDDFLIIIDESHKTIPQIGGMFSGDQSRKPRWWITASACPLPRITVL